MPHSTEDFKFNASLLNYLWKKRNRKLFPDSGDSFGLKNQKFLVFYNLFAKYNSKKYTLNTLMAFKDGPIYYDIYSYTTPAAVILNNKYVNSLYSYKIIEDDFHKESAEAAYLLTIAMTPDQLSEITHKFDFWKMNYEKQLRGNQSIMENDISQNDELLIKWLYEFSTDLYNNYSLMLTDANKFFIRSEYENYQELPTYIDIIQNDYDYNPVIIDIDESGEITID